MYKMLLVLWALCLLTRSAGQGEDTTPLEKGEVMLPGGEGEGENDNYEQYGSGEGEAMGPRPLVISGDSVVALRKRKEYGYMKNLDSLLRNPAMQVEEPESEPPSRSIFDLAFVKLLFWGAAIFAVLFMLYQLFAGKQRLFGGNKSLMMGEEEVATGKVAPSPALLSQQAAARGDYRNAVRYQYAYILQLLNEKGFIRYQAQKTNNQYQNEMVKLPLSPDFAIITLQFEYVWYGGFKLEKQQYETIDRGYRDFIKTWL